MTSLPPRQEPPYPPVEPPGASVRLPDPHGLGTRDLVAVSRTMSPGLCLAAYRKGIFPWPVSRHVIPWVSPDPRALFPLDREPRWARSLRKTIRRGHFRVSVDQAFSQVIDACATEREGGTWTKRAEPVFTARADIPWLIHGVAEPDVVLGPDGKYYLFMSGGLGDDEPRVTGVAVGPTAFGPWELNPKPVLEGDPGEFDACGAFAPSVVIDGDRVRMWYLGIDDCAGACTSCNYAQCGCDARFTIGYAEAPWPLRSE